MTYKINKDNLPSLPEKLKGDLEVGYYITRGYKIVEITYKDPDMGLVWPWRGYYLGVNQNEMSEQSWTNFGSYGSQAITRNDYGAGRFSNNDLLLKISPSEYPEYFI